MTNNLVFLNTMLFLALALTACGGAPLTVDVGTESTNIAINKTTLQSSVSSEGYSGRAVDGNTDGNYGNASVTHTQAEIEPWWQVDLGSIQSITNINIYNRTDNCCISRLSNFYVLVSENAFESESLQESIDQAGVTN